MASVLARWEAVLHSCERSLICLLYTIATVFQLYPDSGMMYEMRRKPKPTLLPTQGIFNRTHHVSMSTPYKHTGL